MSAAPQLKSWQPGQSGNPTGRPKKVFPRVEQLLKEHGKEPIAELLKLLPSLKEREQAQIWMEILPYVHAKVKPIEEEPTDGEGLDAQKLLREIPKEHIISYLKARAAKPDGNP